MKPMIALLVAAAVFLLSMVAFSILKAAAARLRARYVVRSWSELSDLLLFIDRRSLLALGACTSLVAAGIGLVASGAVAAVALGAAGLFAPWGIVVQYRKRRLRSFERQLIDALQSLANALRAGLNLPQALEALAKEAPAPIGPEFGLVVKELKVGLPLEDALNHLAERVDSEDLALAVAATNVARQLGGNMAEMFETIAGTVGERFRLEGRIAALTSQGRLQGWVVAALPLLLGLAMRYLRPDLVDPMLAHPFGYVLIALVLIMEAVGLVLIRRIIAIQV